MFDGSRGERVLQRIEERTSFPHIHERNSKNLVGEEDEERKIPRHGNFEATV